MTTFWKELQRLALGQLFTGGHFGTRLPHAQPTDSAAPARTQERTAGTGQRVPQVRIAACH